MSNQLQYIEELLYLATEYCADTLKTTGVATPAVAASGLRKLLEIPPDAAERLAALLWWGVIGDLLKIPGTRIRWITLAETATHRVRVRAVVRQLDR